jgi:DNA-directed RNA polymerase specialized sigma24 family protein
MLIALNDSELATLAAYVPDVIGGDESAWQALAGRLEPLLLQLLRRSRILGPMRHSVDDCRMVMTNVLERLKKDEFRGLRLFQPWSDANPRKSFGDWIRIMTANLARDHVSSRLGGGLNKRLVNTLASLLPADDDHRLAFRPAMTDAQLARELLDYAARCLDAIRLQALRRWLEGASLEEIASELGLPTARDGDKLVRAALAKLRRHFGDQAHD